MAEYFGDNLKLLCSHYRSIAEVCRKLAINRAQFNKYLSGQSRPTAYNLKRICDFFGVEAYELSLPGEQFASLIGARSNDQPARALGDPLLELVQPLRQYSSSLARYCGYYFEYANCMSVPGQILLSLVHLLVNEVCKQLGPDVEKRLEATAALHNEFVGYTSSPGTKQ